MAKPKKTKASRPETLPERVEVRAAAGEPAKWREKAGAEGRSLSNWLRRLANVAVGLMLWSAIGCSGAPTQEQTAQGTGGATVDEGAGGESDIPVGAGGSPAIAADAAQPHVPSPPATDSGTPSVPPEQFTVHFTGTTPGYTVAPGQETVRCSDVDGPTAEILATGYHARLLSGIHHIDLDRETVDGGITTNPSACQGEDSATIMLIITSKSVDQAWSSAPEYEGAAMAIAAGKIRIAAHMINTGTEPIQASATVAFDVVREATKRVSSFILGGGVGINVPPNTKQTVSCPCTAPSDVTPLFMYGHQHSHGTGVALSVADTEVYRDSNWSDPSIRHYDSLNGGDLAIKKGTALLWTCDINNTTSATIKFGNNRDTGEMCSIFGFQLSATPWVCTGRC